MSSQRPILWDLEKHDSNPAITGARAAGIRDPAKGLDGRGGDWYSLAQDLSVYAESLSPGWTSAPLDIREELGAWIQQRLQNIKAVNNLQLEVDVDGTRNPLLAAVDAVDPCWKTTVLYEQKGVLKMALLAWNPSCESKIHDHPQACWEAHLKGPPLLETPYTHPNHATVQELWSSSKQHPSNANRWIVKQGDLTPGETHWVGEGQVAFDSGPESLHTLGNVSTEEPIYSMHTYIGPYTGNGIAQPPWAQSYVFEGSL